MTADSSSDIWAVGYFVQNSNLLIQTATLHWDGSSWNVVANPNVGVSDNILVGVTSASGTLWAVGRFRSTSGAVDRTLTLRNP